MSLDKIANILGAETVKKIYEDTASPAAQEAGAALADFVKAARLFTAPIQLLATFQDRLTKYLKKVTDSVPEERQIKAPSAIAGPVIEKLKYLEEENYLTDLYLNLLSRAIDRERVNEAHPAFLLVIEQLSPDEALMLHSLLKKTWKPASTDFTQYQDWIEQNTEMLEQVSMEGLVFPKNFHMYALHLQCLGLVLIKTKQFHSPFSGSKKVLWQFEYVDEMKLTTFGRMFVKACIPDGGLPTNISQII